MSAFTVILTQILEHYTFRFYLLHFTSALAFIR